jgi:hypothetical protein
VDDIQAQEAPAVFHPRGAGPFCPGPHMFQIKWCKARINLLAQATFKDAQSFEDEKGQNHQPTIVPSHQIPSTSRLTKEG